MITGSTAIVPFISISDLTVALTVPPAGDVSVPFGVRSVLNLYLGRINQIN
jgi:hypothetical protein